MTNQPNNSIPPSTVQTSATSQSPASPLAQPEPWDLVSEAYSELALPYFEVFSREALHLAALPPSPRIVDVAAGPGTLSLMAASDGAEVSAIDFSPAMLARLEIRAGKLGVELTLGTDAKTKAETGALSGLRAGRVEARQGDGQALPYADAEFDGAFSMFGLIFFPDRAAGFKELHRVLKPGGKAVVASWAPFVGPFVQVMDSIRALLPGMPFGTGKAPLGSPEELQREMSEAGFDDVAVHTFSNAIEAQTLEEFWSMMQRTNAPLVLLRRKLGEEKWAEVAKGVHERLRVELGEGPVKAVGNALLGMGMKAT